MTEKQMLKKLSQVALRGEPATHIWVYKHRDEIEKAGIKIHPSHLIAGKNAMGALIITTN